mgnify:CR=1 FL=1
MKEIKETIYNSVKRMQEAPQDHLIGLSTGFERLDEVLGGLVEGTSCHYRRANRHGQNSFCLKLVEESLN